MIVQGWTAEGPGFRVDMTLETNGELTTVICTQQMQHATRGAAEIMAGLMRHEFTEGKKVEWHGWSPAQIADYNA